MHVPARVRILVSSFGLAALTFLAFAASVLADSSPGPIAK
jgi:hypothetical protein